MKKYIIHSILTVLFAFCLVIPGVSAETKSAASTDSTPQYGGILKIITSSYFTKTVEAPLEVKTAGQFTVTRPIVEPLFLFDKKGMSVQGIALSFDVAHDKKSITMKLRKGVTFHDGTPYNADVVKLHIEKMSYVGPKFVSIKSVDVIDDVTVRLNLNYFDSTLESLFQQFYGMYGSPTAAAKATTPEGRAKDHCVGAGPFKVAEWKVDDFMKYERFDKYWDKGKPYLDGMEMRYVKDAVTAKVAFTAGQAHILMNLSPQIAKELQDAGYKILTYNGGTYILEGDGANSDSIYADKRVRMALEYAIDRKALGDVLGYGFVEPITQVVPSNFVMAHDSTIEGRSYNPEKARELLRDAGYPKGFQTEIFTEATVENREIVEAIQGYLSDVGIKAKVDLADKARYLEARTKGWRNKLMFTRVFHDANYGLSLKVFWDKGSTYTTSMYRPPEFQNILDQIYSEPDYEKRSVLAKKISRTLYDEAMVVPIMIKSVHAATQPNVHDTHMCEFHSTAWHPQDTWLSK